MASKLAINRMGVKCKSHIKIAPFFILSWVFTLDVLNLKSRLKDPRHLLFQFVLKVFKHGLLRPGIYCLKAHFEQ